MALISTLPRISNRAHGRKDDRVWGELPLSFCFFLKDLVLLLPFFIHIKLSVSEIASCAFYYHAIRSCTRVFYEKRLCSLLRLSAKTSIESYWNSDSRRVKSDYIFKSVVYSFNPYHTLKIPKWYSIGI